MKNVWATAVFFLLKFPHSHSSGYHFRTVVHTQWYLSVITRSAGTNARDVNVTFHCGCHRLCSPHSNITAEYVKELVLALGGRLLFFSNAKLYGLWHTVWMSVSRELNYQNKLTLKPIAKPVMYAKLPWSQNKLFFHSLPCNLNRSRKRQPLDLGQGCYFCSHFCVFANRSFSVFILIAETLPWCAMLGVYKLQSAPKTYGHGKSFLITLKFYTLWNIIMSNCRGKKIICVFQKV